MYILEYYFEGRLKTKMLRGHGLKKNESFGFLTIMYTCMCSYIKLFSLKKHFS